MRYLIENIDYVSKEELFQGYERIIYDENGNLIAKLRPGQIKFECTNILKESKFDDYIENLSQNETSIYDIIKSELESKKSGNNIIQQVINIIDKYNLNINDIMNYLIDDKDDSLDKYQFIKQLKVNINKYLNKIKKLEKNKEYKKSIINYFLVISNNKEDLLGASDNRGWTSCIGPEGLYWKYHELSYPNSFIVYIIDKIEKNDNKCKLKIRSDGSLDNVVGRKVIRQMRHGQKYGWCSCGEPFYPVDMDTKFDKMFSFIISKFVKIELCFGEPVGVGYSDFMKYGPYINVPVSEINKYVDKIGKLKNGRVIYELIQKQHKAGIPINPKLREQLIEGGIDNIDYMFLYLMHIDHKDEEIKNIIIQYADAELLYNYLSLYEDETIKNELCNRNNISHRFYCALLEYMKYDKEDKIKQIREELLNSEDYDNAKYLYNYLSEIEDDEIEQKLMEFEETKYPYEFINNIIKDPKLKEQYKNKLKQQILNYRNPQSALYYLQYFDSTDEEMINILLNSNDLYIIGEYININPKFINSEKFIKFRKHILEQNDPDRAFLYLYHIGNDKDMIKIIENSGNAESIFMYLTHINKKDGRMKQALINTKDAEYLFHYLVHVNRYDKEVINALINTNNIHYIFLYLISSVSGATINTQVLNALLDSNNAEYIKNYRDYLWDYLKYHQDDRNYKKKEKIINKLNEKLRTLSESIIYNITNTIRSIIKNN